MKNFWTSCQCIHKILRGGVFLMRKDIMMACWKASVGIWIKLWCHTVMSSSEKVIIRYFATGRVDGGERKESIWNRERERERENHGYSSSKNDGGSKWALMCQGVASSPSPCRRRVRLFWRSVNRRPICWCIYIITRGDDSPGVALTGFLTYQSGWVRECGLETKSVQVCVDEGGWEWVREEERESVCVCEREREKEKERESAWVCACVYVCVHVCTHRVKLCSSVL